jgi:2-methylcitrate dehydratase PrpD
VGQASRNAVVAVRLAQAGFTANGEAIESPVGYYDAYYRVEAAADTPLDALGTHWDLAESGLRIKPYPCGGLAHTAIDAALLMRSTHFVGGAGLDAIEEISVEVTDRTFGRIVFGVPDTELQAKFSMPYLIARAMVDGRVGLGAFTDEAIGDAGVLAVAGKVRMLLGPELKPTKSGRPSVVSVRLRDGRTLVQRVDAPKGGEVTPMTPEELRAKFDECAARVLSPAAAESVVGAIAGLDRAGDVRALGGLLRG